jgi:pyruvate dehydrogenase (quinone)/pyruvate oxidase
MQYSFSRTLCTMGAALPYAIGAQCAHPDRPMIAFTGGGSMSMGMGELAALAQYGLPIRVVVMRNDSLALEVWEQIALLGNPQMGCDARNLLEEDRVAMSPALQQHHGDLSRYL